MRPANRDSIRVSSISQGDQIDILDLLGRPAKRIIFTNTTVPGVTEVDLKVNTASRITVENVEQVDTIMTVWSNQSDQRYVDAPLVVLEEDELIGEGGHLPSLAIVSLEVVGLTGTDTGDLVIY